MGGGDEVFIVNNFLVGTGRVAGVNIIEAIKSGKPFRHKSWRCSDRYTWINDIIGVKITNSEVLSEEREIKDEPLTMEFECGWKRMKDNLRCNIIYPVNHHQYDGDLERFIGKRTRVRIEEIREE